MRPLFQRPGVRRIWILFRWFRISLWLILFLAVAAVSYLHLIGLPDFLKRPLLRRLLAEGVAAQFANMQLGWGRGPSIVIENAAFSRSHQPLSPRLSASRAELELNWDALLHCQIELRSLQVASAQLLLPISETNGDALWLTNVALDMRFYSNDVVRLNHCRGTFLGIQLGPHRGGWPCRRPAPLEVPFGRREHQRRLSSPPAASGAVRGRNPLHRDTPFADRSGS